MRPSPHSELTAGVPSGAPLAVFCVACILLSTGCHIAAFLTQGSPAPTPQEAAQESSDQEGEASTAVVETRPPSRWDRPPPAGGMPSAAVWPARDPALGPSLAQRLEPRERGASSSTAATPAPPSASDDPLGYAHPVAGCFEGTAYLVPARTPELPVRYDALPIAGRLWACEWNAFLHVRQQGLPADPERREWFAIRYAGAFHVRRAGTYAFRISSDDGVRLTIDGEAVVEDEQLHAMRDADGEQHLDAGDHALVLEYYQGPNEVNLQVWVTPPDGEEGLLSVRPP